MSRFLTNNIGSFNTITNVWDHTRVADDRSDILAWLSPLDPAARHRDIQDRRVGGVGEWLLQTEEFRSWYEGCGGSESDNAVLFCYGDPGAGKTYISSLVIDELCDRAGGQNTNVAYFYCDFAIQKEQSSTSILGALLKQLVCGLEGIPEGISRAYQDQKSALGGRGPQLSELVKTLQITCSKKRTFICIDALDQCVEGDRVKLLDSLDQILQKSPDTRIFATGRPQIQPDIRSRLARRATCISITPRRDDIIRFLHTRLDEDTIPEEMDSSLEVDILKRIPENFSEIFLLASLSIDAILQETTIYRRRQKLSTMADDLWLEDAYDATLDRIEGQAGERARLGMATLMWISHAERPLKASELCHALAVEIESPNLNIDNVPSIGALLAYCQGLVTIDGATSTVRLVHFTLREYLRARPELFTTAHSSMAETCLTYLNSQQVEGLSTSPSPDLQDMPFLEYSSLYWGTHAKRDLSDRAKFLALKLFEDCSNHISTKILLEAQKWHLYAINFDKPSLFSGLHCASIFGIVEIVAWLLEMEGYDINQKDCTGSAPLMWAAKNGHERVVEILLGWDDVNPNEPDTDGQTPLFGAARNGHEGVVEILLRRDDINPGRPDKYRQTPLFCAARNGHEGVVEILLRRDDVNPNRPDNHGQTPLSHAARNGHEGVVEILLRRDDVNPDRPDNHGQTPLSHAARNGHEGVVEILLRRDDVNPDRPDNHGQTPLSHASWNGHEEVVELLLGRDEVNPDKPDEDGRTPLSHAAQNGHEGVVKILLGRAKVNPDEPDEGGQTPLSHAAWNGHEGVVEILLGRGDVNPDKPDENGQTPLFGAARNEHVGVVKILLGREDVNHNEPDTGGQTPLWRAARNGREGAVKILLGRKDANPTGRTN